jgi:CubicO group peptidase (beta-lactamase class C family)
MRAAIVLALAAACGATQPRRQLPGDVEVTTDSGAAFHGAKGWWMTAAPDRVVLEDPDRALRMTLVELAEPDLSRAIAAAWQRVEPGFARVPAGAPRVPPPAGDWDATVELGYVTRTDEHRKVWALARRFGSTTYVALVDGDAAALERRDAQLHTILESFTPRGMHAESFAGRAPRALDAARTAELDAFVATAREQLAVPGAAVAVIEHGAVVYEKTIGVRELGRPDEITPETLFLIASITKPMTTFMEAALVDRGVFAWDTPVTKLLPWFALGDPDVTAKLRVWHTSCACTGMPRQDLEDLFEYDHVTPEQRLASMKTMKPTTGFGETFQYSNLMVAAGGFAAAHAYAPDQPLLDAYAAAMRDTVFAPIGMTSTTIEPAVAARADHASPHALDLDGAPRPMPIAIERDVVPIAPAGAVWTNLRDLERFAMTELAGGVAPGGARVVSAAGVAAQRTPRVRSGSDAAYGLGLDLGRFHGLAEIGHDGGAFGFGTMMFLLPEQEVGILVLTNVRDGGGYEQLPFNAAVQRKIVEELFDGKDVAAALLAYYVRTARDATAKRIERVERDPDPAWIARLAGTYQNDALGTVVVRGRTFDAGEWQTSFGRRVDPDGTTWLVFLDPPLAGEGPQVTGDDAHPTLTIQYGPTTYVFTRRAE